MIARFQACDLKVLRQVLTNDLEPAEQAELEIHLTQCDACRRELEQLAGGEPWGTEVREQLSSAEYPAWPADSGVSDGPGMGPNADREASDDPRDTWDDHWNDHEVRLDFLEPSDQPGSIGKLGGYEVLRLIGKGGMGTVLQAHDTLLNRHVAIKVLAAELATSGAARRRFAREAQAAAAVAHEHVVAIHAVDNSGRLPFLVMPYIPGKSLQERLDEQGPLGIKEVLRIGLQVAAGLAAAHAQGLVHRDIKPANILLENGIERVRITDFGLARAVDDASQTQSGFIAGTPQYMAPEQARGDIVDHRADLFSLGSVVYAMCTGRPPFRAETTFGVLRRICEERPRPLCEINTDLPDWMQTLVDKLHARNPDERFQSAAEVSAVFGQYLAHLQQPGTIPLPPFHRQHRKGKRGSVMWPSSKRARAALAMLTAVIVVAIAFVGMQQFVRSGDRGLRLPVTSTASMSAIPQNGPSPSMSRSGSIAGGSGTPEPASGLASMEASSAARVEMPGSGPMIDSRVERNEEADLQRPPIASGLWDLWGDWDQDYRKLTQELENQAGRGGAEMFASPTDGTQLFQRLEQDLKRLEQDIGQPRKRSRTSVGN